MNVGAWVQIPGRVRRRGCKSHVYLHRRRVSLVALLVPEPACGRFMTEFVADLTNRALGHTVAGCGKLLGWSTAPASIKICVTISGIVALGVAAIGRTLALSRVSSRYIYLKQRLVLL